MACVDPDLLAAFAEGALSSREAAELDEHLDACPTCRSVVACLARAQRSPEADPLLEADPVPTRGARLNRFVLLETLGAGGMGIVYSAYDPRLERKVAIKVVRPWTTLGESTERLHQRMMREAKAMARLAHPNVIGLHEVGTIEERVFLAMELVQGGSLRRWLEAGVRPWRGVRDLLLQAARGLAAAHAAGVVHGDFKPENVLVDADGRARVTDFGLALREETDVSHGASDEVKRPPPALDLRLSTVALRGTLPYLAPEQLAGAPADRKTDQFSFAVTAWEAFTGQRPFLGNSPAELARAIHRGPTPGLARSVPRSLRAALGRGLAEDPNARFDSMEALARALAHEPWLARRSTRWAVVAAVLAGAPAGGLSYKRARDQAACAAVPERLLQAWNDERTQAVRGALEKTGKPQARATWQRVDARLDGYAGDWARMHSQACRAALQGDGDARAAAGLQLSCLDRRLLELRMLVNELVAAQDETIVDRAVIATLQLRPVRVCQDMDPLRTGDARQRDELQQQRLATLVEGVSQLAALNGVSNYARALDLGETLVSQARAAGESRIEAELLLALALALTNLGDHDASAARAEEAARAALAAGADDTLVEAYLALVSNEFSRRETQRGRYWVDYATAALERLGPDERLEADFAVSRAYLDFADSHLGEAEQHLRPAMARLAPAGDSLALLNAGSLLGSVLAYRGDTEAAIRAQQEAAAMSTRLFGRETVQTASILNNLANAHLLAGEAERALELEREVLAIRERLLGRGHDRIAWSHIGVGRALVDLGRYEEGLEQLRVGTVGLEEALGRDSPRLIGALLPLGETLVRLGRLREAEALFRRVLDYAQAHGQQLEVAQALAGLAEIRLAERDAAAALPGLQRALAIMDELGTHPAVRARVASRLARAVWKTGGDPEQARTLAMQARAQYLRAAPHGALAEVDSLLEQLEAAPAGRER